MHPAVPHHMHEGHELIVDERACPSHAVPSKSLRPRCNVLGGLAEGEAVEP